MSTHEQRPSRLEDPERPELEITLVVQVRVTCATCGAMSWIEYYDDQDRLVRRLPNTQPCWHYRANQLSVRGPEPSGALDKIRAESILQRERR